MCGCPVARHGSTRRFASLGGRCQWMRQQLRGAIHNKIRVPGFFGENILRFCPSIERRVACAGGVVSDLVGTCRQPNVDHHGEQLHSSRCDLVVVRMCGGAFCGKHRFGLFFGRGRWDVFQLGQHASQVYPTQSTCTLMHIGQVYLWWHCVL
jgi:hypothetical protein